MTTPFDIAGILDRAGADADAPEGSQAWALAQVAAAVKELIGAARFARQSAIGPAGYTNGADRRLITAIARIGDRP